MCVPSLGLVFCLRCSCKGRLKSRPPRALSPNQEPDATARAAATRISPPQSKILIRPSLRSHKYYFQRHLAGRRPLSSLASSPRPSRPRRCLWFRGGGVAVSKQASK